MGRKEEVHRSGSDRVIIRQPGKTGNKVDIFITGAGESEHCHIWVDEKGELGPPEHRGQCDQCPTEK